MPVSLNNNVVQVTNAQPVKQSEKKTDEKSKYLTPTQTKVVIGTGLAALAAVGIYVATRGKSGRVPNNTQETANTIKEMTVDAFKKAGNKFNKGKAVTGTGEGFTGQISHQTKDGKNIVMEYENGILQKSTQYDGKKVLTQKEYKYENADNKRSFTVLKDGKPILFKAIFDLNGFNIEKTYNKKGIVQKMVRKDLGNGRLVIHDNKTNEDRLFVIKKNKVSAETKLQKQSTENPEIKTPVSETTSNFDTKPAKTPTVEQQDEEQEVKNKVGGIIDALRQNKKDARRAEINQAVIEADWSHKSAEESARVFRRAIRNEASSYKRFFDKVIPRPQMRTYSNALKIIRSKIDAYVAQCGTFVPVNKTVEINGKPVKIIYEGLAHDITESGELLLKEPIKKSQKTGSIYQNASEQMFTDWHVKEQQESKKNKNTQKLFA